jgi:hypothetical protein
MAGHRKKRDAEKKTIEIWLECYNKLNGTDYWVELWPDEHDRNTKSIDALCKDSSGKTLGLEHTRVEAFPGEMTDNDRFEKVLGRLQGDHGLAEVGIQTSALIEVESIPQKKEISWKTLGVELGAFLRQHVFTLGIGRHTRVFQWDSVRIPVTIKKRVHLPGQQGSFLVGRYWPGKSNEPTVQKAFDKKLPKLKAAQAERKILLLEQNFAAGSVEWDITNYFASRGLPPWMPDEIWMLWTCALEKDQHMYVAQLHPDMNNRKADWKNGQISMQYP